MQTLERVSEDIRPEIFTIRRKGNTAPIDISGCTVWLKMRKVDADTNYLSGTCSLVSGGTAGQCSRWWGTPSGTAELQPGDYFGELEVHFADGRIETTEKFSVKVRGGY